MTDRELYKEIGHNVHRQTSYSVAVRNGEVIYHTENEGDAFMRDGDCSVTRTIGLDELKAMSTARGGEFYEEAKQEVERQLRIMRTAK